MTLIETVEKSIELLMFFFVFNMVWFFFGSCLIFSYFTISGIIKNIFYPDKDRLSTANLDSIKKYRF